MLEPFSSAHSPATVVAGMLAVRNPPFRAQIVCAHVREALLSFQHLTFNRRPVAEGLVSSLSYGSPRFASVAFAGCAQVLGLFIHRASVAKHLLFIYGESISEVDIWN